MQIMVVVTVLGQDGGGGGGDQSRKLSFKSYLGHFVMTFSFYETKDNTG